MNKKRTVKKMEKCWCGAWKSTDINLPHRHDSNDGFPDPQWVKNKLVAQRKIDRLMVDETKMTLTEWKERYLDPVQAVLLGFEPLNEMNDGFAGFVLDGVIAVESIHGEEATDWECIELVEQFIFEAKQISERF